MKKFFLIITLFLTQFTLAQIIKTNQKVSEIVLLFSNGNEIDWDIPISDTEKIHVNWREQKTSFSKKEGIQSFEGEYNNEYIGVISIVDQLISGDIVWQNETIRYSTSEDGFLQIHLSKKNRECGICKGNHCEAHLEELNQNRKINSDNQEEPIVANPEVLLVYRLALPISYKYFVDPNDIFQSRVENVKMFWANVETKLNRIYMRDLGIKFKVINNENLIIKSEDKQVFNNHDIRDLINYSTHKINDLMGNWDNYDLGVVIYNNEYSSILGIAHIGAAYGYIKGGAASAADLNTLSHEIGHLFGSIHTFTKGGISSYYTEPGFGQSVMSYGKPADFFSLISAHFIREKLAQLGYYEDEKRQNLVKSKTFDHINFPVGIKSDNKAPVIKKDKLKPAYTIPQNTYFQFTIEATDENPKELLYSAHQADLKKIGHAKFIAEEGSKDNIIRFETKYSDNGVAELFTTPRALGDFKFWLGVSDGNTIEERPVKYDVYETTVNIKEGSAFEITSDVKKEYKVGDKITLKWNVDYSIFDEDSKVRILLSDDFGKTFNHTVTNSTSNDGEYEFTIPAIPVGKVEFGKKVKHKVPAGVFKVEVIDHIAYATTNMAPLRDGANGTEVWGGFEIKNATPTQEISINIQTDECQFTFTDKHDLTKEQLGDDSALNLKIIEINGVPQNNLNSLKGIQPKNGENIILWKADNGGVFT